MTDQAEDVRALVARLRDSSGRHINGLYDRQAADALEALQQERDALRALLLDVRDEADARDSEERVSLSDALRDRIGAALKTA